MGFDTKLVEDVWYKELWDFQPKSGTNGCCLLFPHFLVKVQPKKAWGCQNLGTQESFGAKSSVNLPWKLSLEFVTKSFHHILRHKQRNLSPGLHSEGGLAQELSHLCCNGASVALREVIQRECGIGEPLGV